MGDGQPFVFEIDAKIAELVYIVRTYIPDITQEHVNDLFDAILTMSKRLLVTTSDNDLVLETLSIVGYGPLSGLSDRPLIDLLYQHVEYAIGFFSERMVNYNIIHDMHVTMITDTNIYVTI